MAEGLGIRVGPSVLSLISSETSSYIVRQQHHSRHEYRSVFAVLSLGISDSSLVQAMASAPRRSNRLRANQAVFAIQPNVGQAPVTFFSLPQALRDKILSQCLTLSAPIRIEVAALYAHYPPPTALLYRFRRVVGRYEVEKRIKTIRSLCLTSKMVRTEAEAMFYGSNSFTFEVGRKFSSRVSQLRWGCISPCHWHLALFIVLHSRLTIGVPVLRLVNSTKQHSLRRP